MLPNKAALIDLDRQLPVSVIRVAPDRAVGINSGECKMLVRCRAML